MALFNGVGGGAAALVATAEYHQIADGVGQEELVTTISILLSVVIGSLSFAGSLVAFAKLQELMPAGR